MIRDGRRCYTNFTAAALYSKDQKPSITLNKYPNHPAPKLCFEGHSSLKRSVRPKVTFQILVDAREKKKIPKPFLIPLRDFNTRRIYSGLLLC